MKFERYIDELLTRKIFPGITVLAGSHKGEPFKKSYGEKSSAYRNDPLDTRSIYDLASLTKPLITSMATLLLIEQGEFAEDTPISRILPGFREDIRVSHLISHTSGIPAWYPLYLRSEDHIDVIRGLEPVSQPGKKVVYSCLGYILLAEIIRKISGSPFSSFSENKIISRIGLGNTFFAVPEIRIKECVPTEMGNAYEKAVAEKDFPALSAGHQWRTGVLRGEVNDGNSYFLGGSSGNAGLFSNADDIFRLSREFYPEFTTLLKPETALMFWKNMTPFKRSSRTFGFKLNSSLVTSGGRGLSRHAIGHSGFTGTSVWLEPGSANVFIILTNRIHPVYDPSVNFNRIRRRLHRLLKKGLGL